jgi:hypothetical protein
MLMKSLIRCGATAVAVALVMAMAAPVLAANVTVGEFVQRVAIVKNLDATDAQVARDSLRASGVRLPDLDLNAPLTESDVVAVSRAVGLRLTSSNPDKMFESDQVDNFFVAFTGELVNPPEELADDDDWPGEGEWPDVPYGPPFDPWTKGKGKHKGWGKGHQSPCEPE